MKTHTAAFPQAHASFEKFLDHAPMIAWINDAQGALLYMNETYKRIFNLADEHLGSNIFKLFPREIATEYHQNNLEVIGSRQPVELLEKVVLPGNSERIFKISKFPINIQGQIAVAGWGMDITQNLTNSSLLVETHERYTLVQHAVSDAIYDWEAACNRAILEQGFQEIFGYNFSEVTMRSFLKLVHPRDQEKVIHNYRSILNDPSLKKWTLEYRVRCLDGSYKHVLDKGIVARMNGVIYRAIGALRDITENHNLQKAMIAKEKAAKRKLVRSILEAQEHERMNLSKELHDNVNQMLASCKLMLEVAKDGGPGADLFVAKAHGAIQDIISEIRHISHNLNTSAVQDVGLRDAVEGLINQLNSIQGIRFSFYNHLSERLLARLSKEDNIAIYRIIQEQVNNILKHSFAKNASITLQMQGPVITMTLKDDGVGFSPEQVKYGIGFRNIQNRVDYYKGVLQIHAQPGKGATIHISLNVGETQHLY